MTTKNRLKKIEQNAPKNAPQVNPYFAMSDTQLLQKIKATLENDCLSNGEAIPEDAKKMLENALTNNGIEWTVNNDN